MQELMKKRLRELRRRQKRRRQMGIIAAFFGVIVIGGVVWGMARPGVAMTGDTTCGLEEHKHSDKCYESVLVCDKKESEGHKHDDSCYKTEEVLVCDKEEVEANPEEGIEGHTHSKECYEEKKELICKEEESDGHTHSDKCYEEQLVCGKEEHTHEEECYIDKNADVEKQSDWDKQYKSTKWKDAWGDDLVTAADKQVGYKESSKNYKKVNGEQKGYTRFGEFSGEAYADWDAAFVNFCIYYAGISKSDVFPNTTSTNKWYNKFSTVNGSFLAAPDGYEPEKGDIVFFEKKKGETDFTMGIVSSSDKDKKEIKVIEGNVDNQVKEEKYSTGDSQIFAYIKVTELEQAFKGMESDDANTEEEETEEPAESEEAEEEETEDQSPAFDSEYDGDGVIIQVKADEGVIPEGAELSVTPIEKKNITSSMSAEEKEEAEKINAQYDMTSEKLNEESEKNDQTLEGFLAYDISFMLDGKEIEPDGEVKVTMDFKKAVVPEGVSEDAQVAVNHLKENGNGGVTVENLTEASTTNITTAEQDAAVEKVELVADNFSIFTIAWQLNGTPLSMNVEYVDEDGNLLTPKEPVTGIKPDLEKNIIYDLKDLIGDRWTSIVVTEGTEEAIYEPVKFLFDNSKEEVQKVRCNDSFMWEFMDSSGTVVSSCWMWDLEVKSLQIVFQRAAVAEIEIENNIKTTGNLDVKLTGSALNYYNDAIEKNEDDDKDNDVEIKFRWYKKVNNNDFEEVRVVDYDDDTSNISGDYGESLNVALDEGSLGDGRSSVQYKVELYIDGAQVGVSKSESILYYNELQNGSFEKPEITSQNYWDDIPQEQVEGWKTTATNPKTGTKDIEIARMFKPEIYQNDVFIGYSDKYTIASLYQDQNEEFKAADKDQFAELNAESVGSLYQDVLTITGRRLNYHLAHRARCSFGDSLNKDTMYLVIVPTFVAEKGINGDGDEIDTQQEVDELIKRRNEKDENGELLFPGVHFESYTAGTTKWEEHNGTYIPQYNLNRFFFVSAQQLSTQGNFLDDVWFSQKMPEPKEHTFNFRITKTIKGLDELSQYETEEERIEKLKEKIESLEFKITLPDLVKDELNKYIPDSIKATDDKMVWTEEGEGIYTGIRDFYNVPINTDSIKIIVEEQGADIEPYALTSTVTQVSDGEEGEPQSGQSGTVTVVDGSRERLVFENTYGPKDDSIWKVVKRSSSDKTQVLEGAVFTLTDKETGLTRIITGTTDKYGVIQWEDINGKPANLNDLNGKYILRETKAPEGYLCSGKKEGWTLTFNNGKLDAAALKEQIKEDQDFIVLTSDNDVHEISIYNVRSYELPSTGGKGIYLYMFGGILLMAGGLLMTYKNRRRGVLRS